MRSLKDLEAVVGLNNLLDTGPVMKLFNIRITVKG